LVMVCHRKHDQNPCCVFIKNEERRFSFFFVLIPFSFIFHLVTFFFIIIFFALSFSLLFSHPSHGKNKKCLSKFQTPPISVLQNWFFFNLFLFPPFAPYISHDLRTWL
jgi:hypothetical protein